MYNTQLHTNGISTVVLLCYPLLLQYCVFSNLLLIHCGYSTSNAVIIIISLSSGQCKKFDDTFNCFQAQAEAIY